MADRYFRLHNMSMPHEQTTETNAKARHAIGDMMARYSLRTSETPEQQSGVTRGLHVSIRPAYSSLRCAPVAEG